MAILSDHEIRDLCVGSFGQRPMIDPFSEAVSGNGVISYGLSHAGYDLRLGPKILMFKNTSGERINPKRFNDEEYQKRMFDGFDYSAAFGSFTIPPHCYVLGYSLEYLRIPKMIKGRCVGKSTLARSGILINTTPLEPEWEGHLTIEIANITPCPAEIFVGEGIAQLEFETLNSEPQTTYRGKKYQGQTSDPVPARVL